MKVDTTNTVREIALNMPAATRVFEKLGIDYCCGGNKSLVQACGEVHLELQQVLASLESAASASTERQRGYASGEWQQGRDWQTASLADLIGHIENTHHKYVKEETARLGPLFEKVCAAHGSGHPELLKLRDEFRALAQELSTHMMKEEMVLFPYIERMEDAIIAGEPVLPAPFGSVKNPVASMVH